MTGLGPNCKTGTMLRARCRPSRQRARRTVCVDDMAEPLRIYAVCRMAASGNAFIRPASTGGPD
ncbi:hypothetical protein KCP75_22675 [Salmonella enterica subsp. enterica]|nr:hypothetical protein KCP75_22675 [Salmonella enterica subsp. enterica]